MTPPKYKQRKGPGRRKDDIIRDCPYHDGHDYLIKSLGVEMQQKLGLKTAAIMVSILLIFPAASYMAISKYVDTATSDAVKLLRVHIEESEVNMHQIFSQMQKQNATLRIINYRLTQIDKTPETPTNQE